MRVDFCDFSVARPEEFHTYLSPCDLIDMLKILSPAQSIQPGPFFFAYLINQQIGNKWTEYNLWLNSQ